MATATAKPVAPKVEPLAEVVTELRAATAHQVSADRGARHAAQTAIASPAYADQKPAERCKSLVALYSAELGNKTVKASFSAALALILAGVPVHIIATGKSEGADGSLSFPAAEFVPKGTPATPAGDKPRAAYEISAADAVAKLGAKEMLSAATVAREILGIGAKGADKGGRPAKAKETARPAFVDELRGIMQNLAVRKQIVDPILAEFGLMLAPIPEKAEKPKGKRVPAADK